MSYLVHGLDRAYRCWVHGITTATECPFCAKEAMAKYEAWIESQRLRAAAVAAEIAEQEKMWGLS